MCNGTVDFLLKRDRKKQFRYSTLQSETGKVLIQKFHIPEHTDSVILIHLNKVYFESDAAIEISSLLPYPWKLGIIFQMIPKIIRDKIYKWVAKNRYRWFGKRETCRVPTPEEKEFFLL